MADEKALHELKERIADLPLGEQLYLFELVFAEYRRRYKEMQLAQAAADAELRKQIEAQRNREVLSQAEAKREAG